MVQVRKIDVIHSTFAAFAGGIWSWGAKTAESGIGDTWDSKKWSLLVGL